MAKERHNPLIELKWPGQFRQGRVSLLWLPTDAVSKEATQPNVHGTDDPRDKPARLPTQLACWLTQQLGSDTAHLESWRGRNQSRTRLAGTTKCRSRSSTPAESTRMRLDIGGPIRGWLSICVGCWPNHDGRNRRESALRNPAGSSMAPAGSDVTPETDVALPARTPSCLDAALAATRWPDVPGGASSTLLGASSGPAPMDGSGPTGTSSIASSATTKSSSNSSS